jgi:hypothetical protein
MQMRDLFESVRTKGEIDLPLKNGIRNHLPFIYIGEKENGTPYYSSGGRSVLVADDVVYKVSGIDPYGFLTERVATSGKNLLEDVSIAAAISDSQTGRREKFFRGKKRFGIYNYRNVQNAKTAFSRLNESYRKAGICPPCELIEIERMTEISEDAYQMLFSLPSFESDLRVHEFVGILSRKLATAPREELKEKLLYVKRIFGRFIGWSGYAMGSLLNCGLVPTDASWATQNYVLHKIENDYGMFRVDHTSTEHDDHQEIEKFAAWIKNWIDGKEPYFPSFMFSFIPEAVETAALYPEVTDNLPVDQSLSPFQRVMEYYSRTSVPQQPVMDVSRVIESHKKAFLMGMQCASQTASAKGMAIPEEYFIRVLQ